MLNLKNGAFLLGLLVGIALTALLVVMVLALVQVTRPVASAAPQPVAISTPRDTPVKTPTHTPTDTPALEPTEPLTDTPTLEPVEAATNTPTLAPAPVLTSTAIATATATPTPSGPFPVPVPTAVLAPYAGDVQGLGVNLTAVSLNDAARNNLEVAAGEAFDVAVDYDVWSILEPIPGGDNTGRCASTCIVNLTVGIVSSDGEYQPLECIYNGTPGNPPGATQKWSTRVPAPTTPGVYGLRLDYHLTFNCQQALQEVSPLRPAISLATFEVQ